MTEQIYEPMPVVQSVVAEIHSYAYFKNLDQ